MAPVLVVGLAVVLVAQGSGTPSGDGKTGPLPFDPLTADEQAQATATALADARVAAHLDRYEVIGPALNTDKHRMQAEPGSRMADVWLYDYTSDRTVWALVDLRANTVSQVDVRSDIQPPMTGDEMERAATMALADDRVAEALRAHQPYQAMEPTGRLWTGDVANACPVHRCVLVGFFLDDMFQPDLQVRVDLSAQRVDGLVQFGEAPSLGEVRP